MLNSKYAPIFALTVLGVVVILLAGWFLAVKPQFDGAGELRSAANDIDANTASIQEQAARIEQYAADLAAAPSNEETVSLNLPDTLGRNDFRTRLTTAVVDADTEIYSFAEAPLTSVTGWSVNPAGLVSRNVAALFSTGPVRPDLEVPPTYTPVVEASSGGGPLVTTLYSSDFTAAVAGSPAETLDFLSELSDPDARIFQVYSLAFASRAESSGQAGVSDAQEGDVTLSIVGSLFVLDPTDDFMDEEGPLAPSSPNGDAFGPIEAAPAQPGAN